MNSILLMAAIAGSVAITQGPELEMATDHLTIIRWTTQNPGGGDVHDGVVRYGTDPARLDRTAKSPIRLNRGHSHTTFRVRLDALAPRTTYYYTVTSEEGNGKGSSATSAVKQFTTPGLGERMVARP